MTIYFFLVITIFKASPFAAGPHSLSLVAGCIVDFRLRNAHWVGLVALHRVVAPFSSECLESRNKGSEGERRGLEGGRWGYPPTPWLRGGPGPRRPKKVRRWVPGKKNVHDLVESCQNLDHAAGMLRCV